MVNIGVEPNVHTYGAIIDGCARAGQVAKAFGTYGFMRSKVRFRASFYRDYVLLVSFWLKIPEICLNICIQALFSLTNCMLFHCFHSRK